MIKTVNAGSAGSSDTDSTVPIIKIRRNDRVLLVGKTGSGKTHLATILLARLPYLAILDPKHQFTFATNASKSQTRSEPLTLTTTQLTEARRWDKPYPIIYRPDEYEARSGCPDFWRWIWEESNRIVYVDEVMSVSPTTNMPYGYMKAVQMGRGKNIGVWSATQRPARIPQNLISESEHVFAFELRNPKDLVRVADFTDPMIMRNKATGHDCWYYSVRDEEPIKLNANQIRIRSRDSLGKGGGAKAPEGLNGRD